MSVTGKNLNNMCRLCLTADVAVIDIFCFSIKLGDRPSNVIMKCAPVQITRCDEMPNFVCRICYTQIEKIHQFQVQVVQSDKTLRHYLQKLRSSDNQIKPECSIARPSGDPLFNNAKTDTDATLKCESLELHDVFSVNVNWEENEFTRFNSTNKNVDEIFKSEIKDEPMDDPLSRDDRSDIGDTKISEGLENWTEKSPVNFDSENQNSKEMLFEIKSERTDDNSIFLTERVDDTENASSNDDGNEINCADTSGITETIEEANKTKSKLYQCNICDMCFTQLGDLKRHRRWHSKQRTFDCTVCIKSFKKSSHLITHKRAHTGEKPYQCDVCNKTFSQAGNLNIHKRAHTGEKPYQCDVCNRSFVSTNHLKSHKRTHTGKKPYACVFCHKCFAQLSTLNNHKLVIHPGE